MVRHQLHILGRHAHQFIEVSLAGEGQERQPRAEGTASGRQAECPLGTAGEVWEFGQKWAKGGHHLLGGIGL